MDNARLTPVLRHIRKVASPTTTGHSDGQLLHEFAARNDESAFATIIQRHGRGVMGVCRRVLQHTQDAEDAFQATFLVLARKANSVRKSESLASWLHGVSFRIALRARRDAARRRVHEERAKPAGPVHCGGDVTWREVQTVLDEEIERLPQIYRSVFVLCCLQGLSKSEAAQQLHLKEGTVSSRLAQARKRLQKRLASRGISLCAVLGALAVAPDAGAAISGKLVVASAAAAAQFATGSTAAVPEVSARAITLAEGVLKTMLTTKLKLAAILVLTLGLLGIGSGFAGHFVMAARPPIDSPPATPGATEQPPVKPAPPDKAEDKGEKVPVRGQVLDPDGKPVKNAQLYWPRLLKDQPTSEADIEIPSRGTTDAQGHFRLDLPRRDVREEFAFKLMAVADGYGIGWADLLKDGKPVDVTIRLVKDRPIQGRLVDTEGRPVADAEVRIQMIGTSADGKLDRFLTAWKAEWRLAINSSLPDRVFLPPIGKMGMTTTDKEGRFEIKGIGEERLAQLTLRAPNMVQTTLYSVNRAGFDPEPFNKAVRDRSVGRMSLPGSDPLLYGPSIQVVATPYRLLHGTVRESKSGKPIAGVRVWSSTGHNSQVNAVTNEKGEFRLQGLAKRNEYLVHAEPPAKGPYLRTGVRVADVAGYDPIKVELTMAPGIVVTGRIIDRKTGKGVAGGIRFVPLPENTYFGKPGYDSYKTERLMHSSNADGSFRIVVIPGPGVLMAQVFGSNPIQVGGVAVNPYLQAEFDPEDAKRVKVTGRGNDRYYVAAGSATEFLRLEQVVKVLDTKEDAGTAQCDLFVDPGKTATVQIQDADGKALPGAIVSGMTASWPITFSLEEATSTVYALDPAKPRQVIFYHPDRKQAATLTVRGDEKEPLVVKLQSPGIVVGRILDVDGLPLTGVAVHLYSNDEAVSELYRHVAQKQPAIQTDKEGRFQLEGVVPGVKFYLGLHKGAKFLVGEPRIGEKEVAAGKTLDLGDLRTRPQ